MMHQKNIIVEIFSGDLYLPNRIKNFLEVNGIKPFIENVLTGNLAHLYFGSDGYSPVKLKIFCSEDQADRELITDFASEERIEIIAFIKYCINYGRKNSLLQIFCRKFKGMETRHGIYFVSTWSHPDNNRVECPPLSECNQSAKTVSLAILSHKR